MEEIKKYKRLKSNEDILKAYKNKELVLFNPLLVIYEPDINIFSYLVKCYHILISKTDSGYKIKEKSIYSILLPKIIKSLLPLAKKSKNIREAYDFDYSDEAINIIKLREEYFNKYEKEITNIEEIEDVIEAYRYKILFWIYEEGVFYCQDVSIIDDIKNAYLILKGNAHKIKYLKTLKAPPYQENDFEIINRCACITEELFRKNIDLILQALSAAE